MSQYSHEYYLARREFILASNRAYRLAHHDEILERRRAKYDLHRDAKNARAREMRAQHGDEVRAKRRAWVDANKEKVREHNRAYRLEHGDWTHEQEVLKKRQVDRDWYRATLSDQGGLCAICRKSEQSVRKTRLTVDHDHSTGAVRGLLCSTCNTGLGMFRDDSELLELAAAYLRSFAEDLAA